MPTRVIVVQHAEKEPFPGDPGLTDRGRQQAQATAATIAGATDRQAPAAVYSSPLRRARETAAPVAERCGLTVVVDARLRERMNWEGPAEVHSLEEFMAEWRLTSLDRDVAPSVGDSSRDAGRRFLAALEDFAARHPDGTVVAVAHGGVTADLLRTMFGDHVVRTRAPLLVEQGVPSCGLTHLVRDEIGWRVVSVGDTTHLG